MSKRRKAREITWEKPFRLDVEGHPDKLYCDGVHSECGHIKNGLSFRFGDNGCWVVSRASLRRLMEIAKLPRKRKREKK